MRRRAVVGIGIGALALVAAAGLAVWLLLPRSGPEDTARAYLDALQSGDADAVLAQVLGGRDAHADAAAAFTGAEERLADARIVDVDVDGDAAAVTAEATLAGESRDVSFDLERDGDRWRVASGYLGTAEITATLGDAVTVGDAVLAEGAVELLPARYEVNGAPADLVSGSADITVLPHQAGEAIVETALSDAALSQAQEQIDAYAASCTAGGDAVPDACGLRVPWPADFTVASAFAYRVERSPVLRIPPGADAFVAEGGDVTVTVTGTPRGDGPTAVTYRNDAWTLRGDIVLEADGLTLSVR